ncbi:RAQPRD family integrative conjugative element protein [Pseudomonas sp. GWSMS-1]|uniref:integrative conjugative element protein, RAQPRD family n=1 Tax=Pseudomonas sp. GWSMS-1 TaxID=3308997 RepID=UPI003CEBF59B
MRTAPVRCLLLVLCAVTGTTSVVASQESTELSLILQQLDTIETLAQRARPSQTPTDRYRFDYTRLTQDLQRIRQGVRGYLSPSRAQPHDPGELLGDYRLDTPDSETAP